MSNSTIRNLLFLIQKRCLVTSSKLPPLPPPLPQSTEASNFALQFLINLCGLPLRSAIAVSQKLRLQEKNQGKLLSVIDFFKAEGFTQTQIARLIERRPAVLRCKVEANLKPKVEFLKENGFVGELLTELILKNPSIVQWPLGSQMKPSLELLKTYLESDQKIVFSISRSSWLLTFDVKRSMQPNIEFLVKEGVPASSITKILTWQPRAILQKHCRTIYAVNAVKKLGLQPSSPMFVHAFRVMTSMSESTLRKKMELLQSFGWSEEETLSAFKRCPHVMACSEGRIRKSIDFYLNSMKLDLQTINSYPILLCYAIDTRIRPRYIILKILKSKKLIKADTKMPHLFGLTDKAFLDKYVIKYETTIPGLLEIYTSSKKAEKIGP